MDITWDSARCLRLLRPLRTHLAALAKSRSEQQVREAEAARVAEVREKQKDEKKESPDSPDWVRKAVAKNKTFKKQRTYATRPPNQSSQSTENKENPGQLFDGAIQVPSIFVSQSTDVTTTPLAERKYRRRRRNHVRSWKFNSTHDEAEIRVAQSYVTVMAATLQYKEKTSEETRQPEKTGCPSLRCMAIRKVPERLEQEEFAQAHLIASERYDAIESLFGELDEFILPRESGMSISAGIVRAIATRWTIKSLLNGLLNFGTIIQYVEESQFSRSLVALPELVQLKSTALSTWKPAKNSHDSTYTTVTKHLSLIPRPLRSSSAIAVGDVRMFSSLLDNPSIPVDWLGTVSFNDHWQTTIVHASSHGRQYYETVSYITKVVRHGCGLEPMSAAALHTLKHAPTASCGQDHSGCGACHSSHRSIGAHRHQLQAAFTKSLTSLFTILPALVIVGCEEYGKQSSSSVTRYKPNLVAIRSLLQSCAYEILADGEVVSGDFHNIETYTQRSIAVLFSVVLSIISAPFTGEFIDVELNELVRRIIRMTGHCAAEDKEQYQHQMADQLLAICSISSQISSAAPEVFLQYLSASVNNNKILSRRHRKFLLAITTIAQNPHDIDGKTTLISAQIDSKPKDECKLSQLPKQLTSTWYASEPQPQSQNLRFSSRLPQNCQWDSIIDEWVAMTPARPAWAANKVIMETPRADDEHSDEEDNESQASDASFKSHDDTMVDADLDLNQSQTSSPIAVGKNEKIFTGRISDLISLSSPAAPPSALKRYTIRTRAQPDAYQRRLRGLARGAQNAVSAKRYLDDDSDSGSDSDLDDGPAKKYSRMSSPEDYVKISARYKPATKVQVVIHKKAHSPRAAPAWYDDEDELA
jgi:hypothetical protein